ncbi:hypothetical protein F4779DRAFT_567664 [Xylariaceae sp. FL0662B]|nr:hypothetical protein F4779DRAFT_567664 [Xylariaceae sp. FL0662B]
MRDSGLSQTVWRFAATWLGFVRFIFVVLLDYVLDPCLPLDVIDPYRGMVFYRRCMLGSRLPYRGTAVCQPILARIPWVDPRSRGLEIYSM